MGEDDAELVIQLVKELAKFSRLFHSAPFEQICNRVRPAIHFNSAVFESNPTTATRVSVLNLAVFGFLRSFPQTSAHGAALPNRRPRRVRAVSALVRVSNH